MKTVIKNVYIPGKAEKVNVLVEDKKIKAISESEIVAENLIDGGENLLIPGFYNAHCHAAMTVFRGLSDDVPLDVWLFEHIFPAEDKLNGDIVKYGTTLAIAEMLAGGIVSFSDMYFFPQQIAEAVIESGIKSNIARGYTSNENTTPENDIKLHEMQKLVADFNGYDDGRIITEACIHAEYTNVDKCVRRMAEYAKENRLGLQVHISETEKEHKECIERHGLTPIAYFEKLGILDVPVCAAHCVYVDDNDLKIMKDKGVSVAHNPVSNLKLASGVMPIKKMLEAGINVALGTDGAASNNQLDIFREMQTALLIHKGVNRESTLLSAKQAFEMATKNGAVAQRRFDCGEIAVGNRADLVLIDLNAVNNVPLYDTYSMLGYSAKSSNVLMTMVDGKVLYEKGEYKTIDIEKVKYEVKNISKVF